MLIIIWFQYRQISFTRYSGYYGRQQVFYVWWCLLVFVCLLHAAHTQSSSLIRLDLHFRTLEGITVTLPPSPDDAVPCRRLSPLYISSIQVGTGTVVKPRGAFIHLGTVTGTAGILVSIPGRESLTTEVGRCVYSVRKVITWRNHSLAVLKQRQ